MNSPPYHYPYHRYHDPTIINVHTLLKPQPYQYPSYSNTQPSSIASHTPFYQQPYKIPTYVIHQNDFSNPPSTTLTSSYHTPSISSTDIGFILNQISHSQELLKNSLSAFANEVALLKTTLTPHFNEQSLPSNSTNLQTHNGYHYQDLSHTQQQQPPLSLHNTLHPILTPVPSPFNITHTTPKQSCFSHIPSHHHHQPNPVFQFTTPTETSEITTNKETVSTIVHEQELSVEPEINTKDKPHELVGKNGDFTSLAVDSVLQVDKGEKKFVLDFVSISDSAAEFVEKQKQDVTESQKNSFTLTTTASTETKVVGAIVVAETPQQNSISVFQLLDFPINLFDPDGTTTAFDFNRRDWFPKSLNPCLAVFDPGDDEHRFWSSTFIFGNLYFTSPLLVPWDRGKIGSCSILFPVKDLVPVTVLFPVRAAVCGWPWVPCSRKQSVTNRAFDIFDLGGLDCRYQSPETIHVDSCHTLSLMWKPLDRGKKLTVSGVVRGGNRLGRARLCQAWAWPVIKIEGLSLACGLS
ncbi:hypothetical protein P8452_62761 [Trifolium repens]|nr:hypothetical protein P8452_62761 [Trifolium repens]